MPERTSKLRPPVHPGRILKEDLLDPLEISANRLAGELRVPANRLSQIVNGRRAITPDTSLRLGGYFGFSPDYWHNLKSTTNLSWPGVPTRPRSSAQCGRGARRSLRAYANRYFWLA